MEEIREIGFLFNAELRMHNAELWWECDAFL